MARGRLSWVSVFSGQKEEDKVLPALLDYPLAEKETNRAVTFLPSNISLIPPVSQHGAGSYKGDRLRPKINTQLYQSMVNNDYY